MSSRPMDTPMPHASVQLPHQPPSEGTLERWAYDYITCDSLRAKMEPGVPPTLRVQHVVPLRVEPPGRPKELQVSWDKYKAPRSAHALRSPEKRAHLLHTFWHHELQAAELLCWAVLAFPDTPPAFGRGLINICLDEIRHMSMYREQLRRLVEIADPIGLGELFPEADVIVAGVDEDRLALALEQRQAVGELLGPLVHRPVEHDAARELLHRSVFEYPDRIIGHLFLPQNLSSVVSAAGAAA